MAATTAGTPVQATAPTGEKTVTISLPEHVHNHFMESAKADMRTLSQFLKIKLLHVHQHETSLAKAQPVGVGSTTDHN